MGVSDYLRNGIDKKELEAEIQEEIIIEILKLIKFEHLPLVFDWQIS